MEATHLKTTQLNRASIGSLSPESEAVAVPKSHEQPGSLVASAPTVPRIQELHIPC